MPPRWTPLMFAVGLAGGLLLPEGACSSSASAEPAAAVHAVIESQLKLVRQWLDDKDFDSATEAARGLLTLAQLYGHQGTDADWNKRSALLQKACARLADAVQRNSAAESAKAAAECARLLDDMRDHPPVSARRENSKPFGSAKTWMALMEGARVDAKRAETAKELELLTLAVAEEARIVALLRSDARWRRSSDEVRDAALKASRLARDNDRAAARKALKEMYQRCEACHQREQR